MEGVVVVLADRQGENSVESTALRALEGHVRNWMSVVLMVVVVAACHPRYAPLDEGGGGSGGLDSIRSRVLACIAARNYDQAREYLKLAANMADDEVARLKQMISAAERGAGSVPGEGAAAHFPSETRTLPGGYGCGP